ncbi:portal protein [Diaphorobacter nitroreducens]
MKYLKPPASADLGQTLTLSEYADIIDQAIDQPPWRGQADIEADYVDGNQLDSKLLQRLKAIGIPPAKENIIGPAIAAVCGYEAKTRTDWRVTPDGDPGGQDVADALNYRINQAERLSKADDAMSEAFRPQASVGLGWVEVARASDPFAHPYRCRAVHRNEIFWDMRAREKDLSDAAWLLRERFIKKQQVAAAFPKHKDLIAQADSASGMGGYGGYVVEGGVSTGLQAGMDTSRAWTTREQAWYREESDEVCLVELWYRRWVSTVVLKMRGGRVVEFDMANPNHQAAVAGGHGILERATVARVRRSYWMGPHCLYDSGSPYPHRHFPYVPFWGYREDMTGIPFGLVRDMIFPQDNLNSTIAKLRWGMAATRTERTKGAVAMSDEQFRRQIARPDADIILDAEHFRANQGARFEVKRDFQLNNQQFQLMADSRAALERVSGVTAAMQGRQGTARSGLQEQTQLEQSQVSIADLMDNFKEARTQVGELLMTLIIEDMGSDEQTIVIEGDTLNPPRTVLINHPEVDPETGMPYLSNDVQRTRLMVALEDVPTSSSFRAQQLNALSESAKAMPPDLQKVVLPFLIDLMDLPRKKQVVEAIRMAQAGGQADPEAIREQVKHELMHDLKERELAVKERVGDAQIEKMVREAVQVGVQSAFSAMQAAAQVAQMPMIAPVADTIMQRAGYQKPSSGGDDPNFPTAEQTAAMNIKSPYIQGAGPEVVEPAAADVRENTSPTFPPVPQEPSTGQRGIETPATGDNLPA